MLQNKLQVFVACFTKAYVSWNSRDEDWEERLRPIHFLSDVFIAVAVLRSKVPSKCAQTNHTIFTIP